MKTAILTGVPSVGGFQSDSPTAITRRFEFPILRAFRSFGNNLPHRHFRRVTFGSKTAILMERQRWADFSPISVRRNYEGPIFKFCDFTVLSQTNFPNRHFQRDAFLPKTATLAGLRLWVDFSLIPDYRNYATPPFSNFATVPYCRQLIFRIITSDGSHFDRSRPF